MTALLPNTGYIFNFQQGAYSPEGKVKIDPARIDAHNKALAEVEWAHLLKAGRGVLYLTKDAKGHFRVGQWAEGKSLPVHSRWSRHNMAREGRRDVWFTLDGSVWHGVNIGDNDLCRVKRTKEKAK